MATAKLVVRDVFKHYGTVEAVKGISFEVKDGEFVTIVGPSGCGKSSTLRMIAGLEAITKGDILLDGQRINDVLARDRNIALAFESYALYPHMTVGQNLSFPLETRRVPKAKREREIQGTIERLNLTKHRDMKPPELSSGQQQRTSLGRALIRSASIYLLDEPLSHLDAQERVELRTELQRIQKLNGMTFVLVTHDQLEALEMSDRIIVMNFGEIQQIGTPEELYEDPANLFVADFIGEPPMNFVRGTLERGSEGGFRIANGSAYCELPREGVPDLTGHLGSAVTLGIRPAEVELCDSSPTGSLEGSVFSCEDMGEVTYVIVEHPLARFLIQVAGECGLATESRVRFRFRQGKCRFFSTAGGSRIR
jgi:multiple sugar transport system ATP-binding protein